MGFTYQANHTDGLKGGLRLPPHFTAETRLSGQERTKRTEHQPGRRLPPDAGKIMGGLHGQAMGLIMYFSSGTEDRASDAKRPKRQGLH